MSVRRYPFKNLWIPFSILVVGLTFQLAANAQKSGMKPLTAEERRALFSDYSHSFIAEMTNDTPAQIRRANDPLMRNHRPSAEMLRYASKAGKRPKKHQTLQADPITPETQAVMLKSLYKVLSASLWHSGISLNEAAFNDKAGRILRYFARNGLMPAALTVGYMGRYQVGFGMSAGTQFNFYLHEGKLKMSSYSTLGAQIGLAEMSKIEFYFAFCFGACVGGDPTGMFVGVDGSAVAGMGAGFFFEMGLDVSDMAKAAMGIEKNYTVSDVLNSGAYYVGFNIDVGQGVGLSANVMLYSQDFEATLADPSKGIAPETISNIRLR